MFLILAHVLLLDWFQLVAFSPHYISCFSVFLCDCYMFLLYIRYSVFYLAECWVYLRYYKYSSALFWDAVKLRVTFQSTLPNTPWIRSFSSLISESRSYFHPCAINVSRKNATQNVENSMNFSSFWGLGSQALAPLVGLLCF